MKQNEINLTVAYTQKGTWYVLNFGISDEKTLHRAFNNNPIKLELSNKLIFEVKARKTFFNHNRFTNPGINEWIIKNKFKSGTELIFEFGVDKRVLKFIRIKSE